jgi:hypothetical protein
LAPWLSRRCCETPFARSVGCGGRRSQDHNPPAGLAEVSDPSPGRRHARWRVLHRVRAGRQRSASKLPRASQLWNCSGRNPSAAAEPRCRSFSGNPSTRCGKPHELTALVRKMVDKGAIAPRRSRLRAGSSSPLRTLELGDIAGAVTRELPTARPLAIGVRRAPWPTAGGHAGCEPILHAATCNNSVDPRKRYVQGPYVGDFHRFGSLCGMDRPVASSGRARAAVAPAGRGERGLRGKPGQSHIHAPTLFSRWKPPRV